MKTETSTLTMGTRFAHLYQPLIRKLFLIILATAVLAGGALVYFDERLVHSLSSRLIDKSTEATDLRLRRLFESAGKGLHTARDQIGTADLAVDAQREALLELLTPFLLNHEILDSINLADDRGNELVVIRKDGEFLVRQVAADTSEAVWQRRVDDKVVEEWTRQQTVPPSARPWFQGAMSSGPGDNFWTRPYRFLTTEEPGVSVSTRWSGTGGGTMVAAFNITLAGISEFTTARRPSANGLMVVFGPDNKVLGLPPGKRFEDRTDMLSAVLSPVSELGEPSLTAAIAAWEARERAPGVFRFRTPDNAVWWAGIEKIQLGNTHWVWSAVMIPNSDFLGSLALTRNLVLAGIAVAGVIVAASIFGFSMRAIKRQMQAAVDRVERKLGQYHLQEKLGAGGNGAVYRARHALLRRPTAIKLMNPEFARSEAARKRFEHEVQITSSLSHPNTVAIYDYGQTPDGTLYYAMELLNGRTLEQLIRGSGPLSAARAIHILQQIAGSLAEAHGMGLIHRDIKPSNAILCERGGLFDVVKVTDFGLVKEIAQTDGDLTHANVLIGTPLYMAPEVITQPGAASPQSDLYALGAVGYFLVTGRNVFEGSGAVEICAKHLNDEPVPPSQRSGLEVPQDLEALILDCLAKDPKQRPADAASVGFRLAACEDAQGWSQADARAWWQTHAIAATPGAPSDDATPLSHTELLIDFDHRAVSAAAKSAAVQ
jgi:tRNA A-37 threonylcarbamoyl transferase component Bud32